MCSSWFAHPIELTPLVLDMDFFVGNSSARNPRNSHSLLESWWPTMSRFAIQPHVIPPTARYPQDTRTKCHTPSLTEPLCDNIIRPSWWDKKGYSSDRLRYSEKYHRNKENDRPKKFFRRIIWRSVMGYRPEKNLSGNYLDR